MSEQTPRKNHPLVSIGVSAYNRKEYLKLCLESLLAQTYSPCEIIVVDDGSTDGTEEMMKEQYPAEKFPQITYVRQPNAGDGAAKNHAVRLARGEYIVFNDSDDVFMPDAVERLYNALPENDKTACSYGTYQTIDKDGNELPTKRKLSSLPSGSITNELLRHIFVCNCGTLIPRETFLKSGGLDETLKVSYDWALLLELSRHCNFYPVEKAVFYRRRHGSNLSSATYKKLLITYNVFEDFVSRNPDIAVRYAETIRTRRGDFHRKLYREAKKEQLQTEARKHAKEAFRNLPSLKNLAALLRMAFR